MASFLMVVRLGRLRETETAFSAAYQVVYIPHRSTLQKSTMPIDLYYAAAGGPCRSVVMTAKALGVKLNLITVDIRAGDNLKPEFVKLNPQHTIPTLNDNGFVVWESRAIMAYLADQYGKDDSLYPKDPKKRAVVDMRLYFDAGTLYQRGGEYFYPVLLQGAAPDPEKLAKLEQALDFLNTFLEGENWVAGSNMTIADITIESTIGTIVEGMKVSLSKFPNVEAWFERVKKIAPDEGIEAFKQVISLIAKR